MRSHWAAAQIAGPQAAQLGGGQNSELEDTLPDIRSAIVDRVSCEPALLSSGLLSIRVSYQAMFQLWDRCSF